MNPKKTFHSARSQRFACETEFFPIFDIFHENQTSESLDDVDAEPDIPVSETPEQLMINKESLTELHHRIDEMLTDFEKSVFALYVGSMSYMDIAKALSKPKKSIDNAIHRIKAKLRKLL